MHEDKSSSDLSQKFTSRALAEAIEAKKKIRGPHYVADLGGPASWKKNEPMI